jgi:hypothetical protein
MPSFADELEDALADIRSEFGASATYYRGQIQFALSDASRGKTDFRFVGEEGQTVRVQSVDWLFSAAELTDGEPPKRGDRIGETLGGKTHYYEVASINGEPCWAWSDPKKTQYRVHTVFLQKLSG